MTKAAYIHITDDELLAAGHSPDELAAVRAKYATGQYIHPTVIPARAGGRVTQATVREDMARANGYLDGVCG